MKKFSYTITDPLGIHARPAGMLVKETSKYQSAVTITCNEKKSDAKRIMSVMSMAIKQGMTVTVKCEGVDEAQACDELKYFFEKNV